MTVCSIHGTVYHFSLPKSIISHEIRRFFCPEKTDKTFDSRRWTCYYVMVVRNLCFVCPFCAIKALNRHGKRQENAAAIPEGGEP